MFACERQSRSIANRPPHERPTAGRPYPALAHVAARSVVAVIIVVGRIVVGRARVKAPPAVMVTMPVRGSGRRHERGGAESGGGGNTQDGFLQHGAIS